MTKIFLVLISLVMAVPAFGRTIVHPSCYVYLPVNEVISTWATLREIFLNKGYTPIETKELASAFKEDSLIAGINYNLAAKRSSHKYGIQTSTCTVTFKLERLVQADPLQLGLLYTTEKTKTSRRFGEDLPSAKCPDEAVLNSMPECHLSR